MRKKNAHLSEEQDQGKPGFKEALQQSGFLVGGRPSIAAGKLDHGPERISDAPEERFDRLALAQIVESKTNPRRTFHGLEELAESIKTRGVIQPIRVRPIGIDAYELVCGARRYRASKMAGVADIPCMVREMTDDDVLQVQVIENDQREDVPYIEQGMGYAAMVKAGHSVEEIASRIGRDATYVYQRLCITKLIPEFQKLALAEKLPFGHARLIARVSAETQKELADEMPWADKSDDMTPSSISRLKSDLDDLNRSLAGAAFKKDDATLLPAAGPCTTCPHRTGFNRSLFADISEKDDQCTKACCFEQKVEAFVARKEEDLKAKGEKFERVWDSSYVDPALKKRLACRPTTWEEKELTAKQLKAADPAQVKTLLMVGGKRAGRVIHVSVAKDSFGSSGDSGRYDREAKRKARASNAATDRIRDLVYQKCLAAKPDTDTVLRFIVGCFWERSTNDVHKAICKLLDIPVIKSSWGSPDVSKMGEKHIAKLSTADLAQFQMLMAAQSLWGGVNSPGGISDSAREACKVFGIDAKAIYSEEFKALAPKKKTQVKGEKAPKPGGLLAKLVKKECSVCGCTDDNCEQCIKATGHPCEWANADHTLCSRCLAEMKHPTPCDSCQKTEGGRCRNCKELDAFIAKRDAGVKPVKNSNGKKPNRRQPVAAPRAVPQEVLNYIQNLPDETNPASLDVVARYARICADYLVGNRLQDPDSGEWTLNETIRKKVRTEIEAMFNVSAPDTGEADGAGHLADLGDDE